MSFYSILTRTGQAALANAGSLGHTVKLSHMAVGDGSGKAVNPDEHVSKLTNEVYRGTLNQLAVDENNPNWLIAELIIPSEVGSWTIREVGIFAESGHLFAYGNFPDTYKPKISEGASRELVIRMVLQVSSTANVELKVDPAVVLATRDYVDRADQVKINEHEAKDNPHPQYAYNRNCLINGDFALWPRGESFTDTSGGTYYTAARWRVSFKPKSARTVNATRQGNSLRVDIMDATEVVNLGQFVENFKAEAGETFTLSFEVKSDKDRRIYGPAILGKGKLIPDKSNPSVHNGEWQKIVFYYNFNESYFGNLPVYLCGDFGKGNSSVSFRRAQFEPGKLATNFTTQGFMLEQLKSQRFHYRTVQGENYPIAMAYDVSGGFCTFKIQYPVQLTGKPSVAVHGNICYQRAHGEVKKFKHISQLYVGSECAILQGTFDPTDRGGQPWITVFSDGDSYIDFNAEKLGE
ncbi:phage tail protein [Lentisphaerota bacterium ZTH]|nr:phage tail protein [Lentisphaerota bacterium]WET05829.1 phage tail protein [Lentisphaerota bacterium ZTH]